MELGALHVRAVQRGRRRRTRPPLDLDGPQGPRSSEIQKIANEDVPYVIPYFYDSLSAYKKNVTGIVATRPRPLLPAARPASPSSLQLPADQPTDPNGLWRHVVAPQPYRAYIRSRTRSRVLGARRRHKGVSMRRFILQRLASIVVTLWLLATIVFLLVNVLPGDVGRQILGPFAPQDEVDAFNAAARHRPAAARAVLHARSSGSSRSTSATRTRRGSR